MSKQKKIFITYGTVSFRDTLCRIRKEARRLHLFDKIIVYTEKDLSLELLSHPLLQYARGGGYWCWKPYIILKTMKRYPNALVVYADAGCTLQKNREEWAKWFELMKDNDMLVTAYQQGRDYGWQQAFGTNDIRIGRWIKRKTRDYFDERIGDSGWHSYHKIWGGFCINKSNESFLYDWQNTMLQHPELLIDPTDEEKAEQYPEYVAHRHDQAILTALVYEYVQKGRVRICVLPETAETDPTAAVVASRICNIYHEPMKTRLIHCIKNLISERGYKLLHFWG